MRLGDRLEVRWNLPDREPSLNLPALTLQPLVENAIYHGIEPLPDGGIIEVSIDASDSAIIIAISNPIVTLQQTHNRKGNQMAVDNIKERLALAFDGAASMALAKTDTRYTVTLTIPTAEAG